MFVNKLNKKTAKREGGDKGKWLVERTWLKMQLSRKRASEPKHGIYRIHRLGHLAALIDSLTETLKAFGHPSKAESQPKSKSRKKTNPRQGDSE